MPTNNYAGNDDAAGNKEDAAQKAFRRVMVASMSGATLRTFAAAASLLIADRRGTEMTAPEPLVQVGFEPDDDEMASIVGMAKAAGRDLIHIGCDDRSGRPTGMIAVAYFEDGKLRPHRRCGLLCAPGSQKVLLSGVSDEEDETCHFTLAPGQKMARIAGYPIDDIGAGMKRAGELWFERMKSLEPSDCANEILRIPGVLQGPGGPS